MQYEVIRVSHYKELCVDMENKVTKYLRSRKQREWKTATQIAREIGFSFVSQRETRAVTIALRKIGMDSKGSCGLKFFV